MLFFFCNYPFFVKFEDKSLHIRVFFVKFANKFIHKRRNEHWLVLFLYNIKVQTMFIREKYVIQGAHMACGFMDNGG